MAIQLADLKTEKQIFMNKPTVLQRVIIDDWDGVSSAFENVLIWRVPRVREI